MNKRIKKKIDKRLGFRTYKKYEEFLEFTERYKRWMDKNRRTYTFIPDIDPTTMSQVKYMKLMGMGECEHPGIDIIDKDESSLYIVNMISMDLLPTQKTIKEYPEKENE